MDKTLIRKSEIARIVNNAATLTKEINNNELAKECLAETIERKFYGLLEQDVLDGIKKEVINWCNDDQDLLEYLVQDLSSCLFDAGNIVEGFHWEEAVILTSDFDRQMFQIAVVKGRIGSGTYEMFVVDKNTVSRLSSSDIRKIQEVAAKYN
jgi:hypothetical protein